MPAFNNRGFAPSHNVNIQDIVQINELENEDETEDSAPIAPKTKVSVASSDDDDEAMSFFKKIAMEE